MIKYGHTLRPKERNRPMLDSILNKIAERSQRIKGLEQSVADRDTQISTLIAARDVETIRANAAKAQLRQIGEALEVAEPAAAAEAV